jgi:anaerobic ribonucleoside-triphosphate reductase/predicted transcriptional regulator
MLRSVEKLGAAVFDAASAPLRMQVLRLLSTKGALPYTEIMSSLKLDPVRDAGKFVYHLRSLTEAGLISSDKRTKKYEITELGDMVVHFARDLEEYVGVKRGRLFVRTSRLAIEDFHRSKIAKSLVVEAGVPQELADEIAAEAEDRLIKLRTSYLTAALIREFVNAILIEKKLEEYRHKLTRVGMPVYDVTQLLLSTGELGLATEYVQRTAGASVLGEYVLLECLPREIADAHISGRIHISDLESWPLKPSEVQHDLRYFLKNGLVGSRPPQSLNAALAMIQNVYRLGIAEISGEQSFDLFNIFLSPYVEHTSEDNVRESLAIFISSVSQDLPPGAPQAGMSLGLEYVVPEFLQNVEAIGPGGRTVGVYADYHEEAGLLLDALMEVTSQEASISPTVSPRLVFKIRNSAERKEETRFRILETHKLASSRMLPHIALLPENSRDCYTATGMRLTDDWSGQWESDCFRTGCMATVFLNLPRLAYEARRADDRFLKLMTDVLALTLEALKIKRRFMIDRLKQTTLPLLSGHGQGSPYIREKMATYAVAILGLNEACLAHTGSELKKDSLAFAEKILHELKKHTEAASENLGMHIVLSERPGDDATSRLAELDIEQYGKSTVSAQGARNYPFYTDIPGVPLTSKIPFSERLSIEGTLQALTPGGHLALISVDPRVTTDGLLTLTLEAASNGLRFIAYSGLYSFCKNCNRIMKGLVMSCDSCASDNIVHYGRSSSTYLPLRIWPEGKRRTIEKRTVYSIP